MDLHDFKDVAENYDRYLEVMYSQENSMHENFQEFYLELARKYGAGGVVDVACGTGAVLLYLAQSGIEIDGTDISEEMCRIAMNKAKALGLQLNIIPADMTVFFIRTKVFAGDHRTQRLYASSDAGSADQSAEESARTAAPERYSDA